MDTKTIDIQKITLLIKCFNALKQTDKKLKRTHNEKTTMKLVEKISVIEKDILKILIPFFVELNVLEMQQKIFDKLCVYFNHLHKDRYEYLRRRFTKEFGNLPVYQPTLMDHYMQNINDEENFKNLIALQPGYIGRLSNKIYYNRLFTNFSENEIIKIAIAQNHELVPSDLYSIF